MRHLRAEEGLAKTGSSSNDLQSVWLGKTATALLEGDCTIH